MKVVLNEMQFVKKNNIKAAWSVFASLIAVAVVSLALCIDMQI